MSRWHTFASLLQEKRLGKGVSAAVCTTGGSRAKWDLKADQRNVLVGVLGLGWRALMREKSLPLGFAGRRRCVKISRGLRLVSVLRACQSADVSDVRVLSVLPFRGLASPCPRTQEPVRCAAGVCRIRLLVSRTTCGGQRSSKVARA